MFRSLANIYKLTLSFFSRKGTMRERSKILVTITLSLLLISNSFAAVGWNNKGNTGDGKWTTAANWSSGSIPGSGDTVQVSQDGTLTGPTIDTAAPSVTYIQAGVTEGGQNSVHLVNGGSISVANYVAVGFYYDGLLSFSGNSSLTAGQVMAGFQNNAYTGTINMSDTSRITTSGGDPDMYIGWDDSSTGIVNMYDNSSLVVGDDFRIGGARDSSAAGATGTLNVFGNGVNISVSDDFEVGRYGTGYLNMNAGNINVGGSFVIGTLSGSSGEVHLDGGILSIGYFDMKYRTSTVLMDITEGTLVINGYDKRNYINYLVTHGYISGYGFFDTDHVIATYDSSTNITTVTAVPEPATSVIMLLGIGALGFYRKKK